MYVQALIYSLLALVAQASEFSDSKPPPWEIPISEGLHSFGLENPHNRILVPAALDCPPGHSTKSDGSICVSCGTLCAYCDDFTQTCLSCLNPYKMEINPSDKTQCRCKGTQILSSGICSCGNNQWFDGFTCQSASSTCTSSQYINEGTCTNCSTSRILKMRSFLKTKTNPSCCGDQKYLNSNNLCHQCSTNCNACEDTTGDCVECEVKITTPSYVMLYVKKTSCCKSDEFWNTSANPQACQKCAIANCLACQDGDGTNCVQCGELVTMKNVPVKAKKTSCCGAGKYRNGSNCDSCPGENCLDCLDNSGDCISCVKTISGANRVNIKLSVCCKEKEYWNINKSPKGCDACPDTNCGECENVTGKCLHCSDDIVMKNIKADIKKLPSCCGDKLYYKAGATPNCQSCQDNCDACKDGDGSCLKCEESVKMTKVPVKKKKTSCCTDDSKYWSSNNKCETCPGGKCLMCKDVSGDCIRCDESFTGHVPYVTVKTCCGAGKYYSATTQNCQPCSDTNCNSCENISGKCLECDNSFIIKKAKADIKKLPSCCGDKQYYKAGVPPNCQTCPDNCDACKDGDGSCLKCEENLKATKVPVKKKKTSCCTDDSKYWSSNNKCETCPGGKCLMCKDVSGDCIRCDEGFTGHAPYVTVKTCCGAGKYYSATTHNCQPCSDINCKSCENISGKCLECDNSFIIKKAKADIKKQPSCCGDKQYYKTDATPNCQSCPDNCDACKDGDGACIKCEENLKASKVPVKLKKTSCCSDSNKYWSSNNKCETCPGNYCQACKDVSGDCISCDKDIIGHKSYVTVKTCCDPGKYYSATTHNCQSCPDTNCGLCENITGKCLQCSNEIKIKGVKAGIKKTSCCSSTTQYYDNTQHKCVDCVADCKACEDVTGKCLQCEESLKSKAFVYIKKTSCCGSGKFWNDTSKKCENCDLSCEECEDVTGACFCSKNFGVKGKAGLKKTSCCESGKYWDNTSCKACQENCIECQDESGDCLSCNGRVKGVTKVFSKTGNCCPDGDYYEDGGCKVCNKPCATCTSATKCSTCTENATFDKTTNTCTCKNGYNKSTNDCNAGCPAPCITCTSDIICTSCKSHASLDSSTKFCNCNSGYTLNSTSTSGYCIANCNSLCTECSIDDGNKCNKCVTNAELSGTKCSCTANSYFDETSKTCVCNGGYTLSYNKCVSCKKYLSPSDVKAANFSSTWTSINVYFSVKLDTKLDPACSKVFNSTTLALLGTGPICSWLDQKTLKVVLGSLFTLRNQTMYLDGTYLVKDSNEDCSMIYQPLSVVPKTSTSPAPTAMLSGPSSASLSCGGSDTLKYSGEKSTMSIGSMSYAWSSTISPANSQLGDFIKSQKASSISIARCYFDISATTTLNLTLQVTNYFGLKSTTWLVTTVTGESSLSVIFDQGSSISMKASSSSTIKAKISSLCANSTSSTFSWSWKYYSGPTIDSTSILQNANNDKLTINKNALAATTDTPYVFMAIAAQAYNGATITGNSTISITVTSSPLSIQLSKTSGDVSPDSDYNINASGSKDPDDSTGSLAYSWSCVNSADSTTCIGNDGQTLLDNETNVDLKIPSSRLVKGAQWDITCKISKDVRTASATVTLTILSTTATASAEIQLKSEKFNPQGTNQFSASVTSNYNPTLLWSVTSGQDITISPNYLSTISLPSGTLSEGQSYTFTLSISAQGKTFTVHLPIYSNLGATCTGSAISDPTTGNALTTSFKLSIDGCYDKDEEDYPLTYRYLDTNSGKTYTLGYTTEINYLSTYLFPNENDITIKVCDSLITCSDYSLVLNISPNISRRLSSSSMMDAYLESTIDSDNIPATISLFCGSATIDSELFTKMWSDLQSYVANNKVTNDLLQNALGATYSMTTQTEQMSAQMFTTMAAWLAGVIANNPSLVPSQENMVTVVALVNNYLSYGYLTNYAAMTLEDYILNADNFLTYWEIAATLDDLVTQSAMDGSQNTYMTKVFKYRDFPNSMIHHTIPIGTSQTISIPTNLSYADTNVMNIKLHYYNISEEASDITMISFTNSGSYVNYELKTSAETYVPFSTSDYPFVLELPINIDLGKHYAWNCLFYNETNKIWIQDGCEITEIKNNSILFEVYHFSMFKLSQTEIILPIEPTGVCGDNFAPIYILVVILFLSAILAPILSIIDHHHHHHHHESQKVNPVLLDIDLHPLSPSHLIKKEETETVRHDDDTMHPHHDDDIIHPNNPLGSLALESIYEEIHVPDPPNVSILIEKDQDPPNVSILIEKDQDPVTPKSEFDFIKAASTKAVFTEFHSGDLALQKSDTPPEHELTRADSVENELQELLEGNMLFGLLYFRHKFSRVIRLFILVTVLIFELLLEGLLIYGFENISTGDKVSTETLFNDYQGIYFGYTILALVIAAPVEIFMISAFALHRAHIWALFAVILGCLVIIGSIIGIVMLNIEFCFEWSGYWAISFLYGALVQIFVMETLYMIGRFIHFHFFSHGEKH